MRCAYPPYRTGPAVGWIRRAARCQGPGTPVVRAASTKGLRDAAQIWNCWAVERAGEVDANQADATRTLPGKLYGQYLAQLIRDSRRQLGWDAPWFVAQVSYHVPGDEASPDIRAAQQSLWVAGLALEGPDSDALKAEFRENDGKGVHFSGPGLREHAARWVAKVAPWTRQIAAICASAIG